MKKILFALIACLILAVPVMAQTNTPADELTGLSNQQLLAVYDAVVGEIQKRGVDTSSQTIRDSTVVFGQNVHIQTGQLSVCLPTAVPSNELIQLPIAPTATPMVQQSGDKASYDSQTPQDGTHVGRGQIFDITWYLLNTGTTTWTEDYVVRYFSGTNFTKPGKLRYPLGEPGPPNSVGACKVDAVAPGAPGTYTMAVVLGNENDENFFIMDVTIVVD